MTDTDSWNSDWMETQRKYWQAWTDMGLNTLGQKIPAASPWEGALNHWWGTLAPTAPDASRIFIDKLMEQSKHFLRMSDDLYRNLGAGKNVDEWTAILQKTFGDPLLNLGATPGSQDEAMRRMLAFWEMPLDNWQKMVTSLSLLPNDALRHMPHEQIRDNLQRFLNVPGFGYTRERQGQYQDLVHCATQYQTALQEYTQFFSTLGVKSAQRMRERMDALNAKGTTIESARGLYDIWVGCCEDVYAEQVMAPEYAVLHGKLVNTMMAFKQRMSAMVDESLAAMNMPTKAELRTLQDRLQETRRENKTLRRDIDALRELVAALDAGVTPAPTVAHAAEASRAAPLRRNAQSAKSESKGE